MLNLNALRGVAYRESEPFSVPQLGYLGYRELAQLGHGALQADPIPFPPASLVKRMPLTKVAPNRIFQQAVRG
jgi:hypothetical protein